MASLGDRLIEHADELVQRWYDRWKKSGPAVPTLTEAAIKDHLPVQLRAIGEAMREGGSAESPRQIWEDPGRLDPEQRVREEVPIEEVVREYGFVLDEVRTWISEQEDDFSFDELSFVFLAIFELAAESARRFAKYEAEQLRRARSEYVAGIAHQIRTPVSTIRMVVQKAERAGGGLEPQDLARARRSVNRLGRLVDGLMRLERFGAEETPVHPVPLQPAHVIDELLSDHEHDAIRKGLRLDVAVNRSATMVADPDLLVDALGNLIQNAIKYTNAGHVRIEVIDEAEWVTFRIEDSGPGISPERQRELFKPVRPGMPGGVGLGLSIAMRAARAQGGTLQLESEVGKGSTFVLRIPREVGERSRAD